MAELHVRAFQLADANDDKELSLSEVPPPLAQELLHGNRPKIERLSYHARGRRWRWRSTSRRYSGCR
jgi:hypothetical protein